MATQGFRFRNGKVSVDKPFVAGPRAWIEPTGGAIAFEDFIGDHIAEDSTVLVNQAGTATTAAAVGTAAGPQSGHLGWLAGSVDNVDAEIDEVALGAKPWSLVSAGVTVAEIGLVIPTALTARQYFFGLTDDETEGTGTNGSLNIQTAYTLVDVADDAAGFIFSSLATAPTIWKWASTNAGTGSTVSAATETVTAAVDDYTRFRVEIDAAGNAYYFSRLDASGNGRGKDLNYVGTKAEAVATTAVLLPLFSAAATTTTAVEWEIDYILGAAQAS